MIFSSADIWKTYEINNLKVLYEVSTELSYQNIQDYNSQSLDQILNADSTAFSFNDYHLAHKFYSKFKKGVKSKKNKKYQEELISRQKISSLSNRLLVAFKSWDALKEIHPELDLRELFKISLLDKDLKNFYISISLIMALSSAYQRFKNGHEIMEGIVLSPYYGVYLPIRKDPVRLLKSYLDTQVVKDLNCLDFGCGSGILSLLLAKSGAYVTAIDTNPLALLSCEREAKKFQLDRLIKISHDIDSFKDGFDLIVCNPPWIPGKPSNLLNGAIYCDIKEYDSFFQNLHKYMKKNGRLVYIFSNFAELSGLLSPNYIEEVIKNNGFKILEKVEVKPSHKRITTSIDLQEIRQKEVVTLYEVVKN